MSITERAERLAANLLADRQRQRSGLSTISSHAGHAANFRLSRHGAASVWIAVIGGRSPDTSNGNFCSRRCQDWYDDGNPTYEQQCEHERKLTGAALGDFVVVAGPPDLEAGSKYYRGLGFRACLCGAGLTASISPASIATRNSKAKGRGAVPQTARRLTGKPKSVGQS